MITISNFGASDLKNLRTGKIFTEHVEKWRFPGAPLPMLPHPRLTSGPAVSAPKENVEGDHGLVEIRLEGGVSPLRQPAVAQVALQSLDHAPDGGQVIISFIKSGISLCIPGVKTEPVQFPCELSLESEQI